MKKLYMLLPILALTLISSCKKDEEKRTVEYSIQCADCFVVCYDENGDEKSWEHQNSNWTYSFDGKQGDQVLIMAHNTSSGFAQVGATIKLNGNVLQTGQSYCPINGIVLVNDTLE